MVRVFASLRFIAVLAAFSGLQASAGAVDVSHSEFPAENNALIAATQAFFDEIEGVDAPRSQKRPVVIGLPLAATNASAAIPENEAGPLRQKGPVQHLTGYNVTWYPMDHLLGSVDFMGTWDGNRNLVCGFLTWDLSEPDAPDLVAVEASYVDLDELSAMSPLEVHQELLSANCAFGAIDENYAFFDVAG